MPSLAEYLRNAPQTFENVFGGTGEEGEPGLGSRILSEGLNIAQNLDYGPISAGGAAGMIRAFGREAQPTLSAVARELNPSYFKAMNSAVGRRGKTVGAMIGSKTTGDVDFHTLEREAIEELRKLRASEIAEGKARGLTISYKPETPYNTTAIVAEHALPGNTQMHELGGHVAADRLRPSTAKMLRKNFLNREDQITSDIFAAHGSGAREQMKDFFDVINGAGVEPSRKVEGATQEILARLLQGHARPLGPERHLLSKEGRKKADELFLGYLLDALVK